MALDTAPGPESKKDRVPLYKNKAGELWYRGPDGTPVVLDEAGEDAYDIIKEDPDAEPPPGYPHFERKLRSAEMPTDGSDKKREELGMLINNIVGIPALDLKKFTDEFELAEDDRRVDALKKRVDRYLARHTGAQNAAPNTAPNAAPNATPNTTPVAPNAAPAAAPKGAPKAATTIPRPRGAPAAPPNSPLARLRARAARSFKGLDPLYKQRDARDALKKESTAVNAITGEKLDVPADMLLADVMATDEQQQLFFGKFLHRENPKFGVMLVRKLAADTLLEPSEDTKLDMYLKKYSAELHEARSVKEYMTAEHFKRIAQADPRIAEIVGKIGHEQAEAVIEPELMDLMITDPTKFRTLRESLKAFHSIDTSKRAKLVQERLDIELRRQGMTKEQFTEFTQSGNPAEASMNFQAFAREKMNYFQRGINFKNWLTKRTTKELYQRYKTSENLRAEADMHLRSVAWVLHATLTPEVRMRIQKLAMDGVLEERPRDTVGTVKEYATAEKELSNEAVQAGFEAVKAAEAKKQNITDWSAPTNAARLDSLKGSYAKTVHDKQQKYTATGLFKALIMLLFRGRSSPEKIKDKLK